MNALYEYNLSITKGSVGRDIFHISYHGKKRLEEFHRETVAVKFNLDNSLEKTENSTMNICSDHSLRFLACNFRNCLKAGFISRLLAQIMQPVSAIEGNPPDPH